MRDKLKTLREAGKITPYLYEKAIARADKAPEFEDKIIKESIEMSAAGVDSDDDIKSFFYISMYAKPIARNILGRKPELEELSKISNLVFEGRKDRPIDTVAKFHEAVGEAIKKLGIYRKKIAYPQGDVGFNNDAPRNIQKWMDAMQKIYANGQSFEMAFNKVTENWDNMEKRDFRNWMSFYQENAHNKYKTAQPIPNERLKASLPMGPDMSQFTPKAEEIKEKPEEKDLIRKRIQGIIGRLNAAERLATDPKIQELLSKNIDMPISKWLEQLHAVKRVIQSVQMKFADSSLPYDVIYKQANLMEYQGYPKAAGTMRKLGQAIQQNATPPGPPPPAPPPPGPPKPPQAKPPVAPPPPAPPPEITPPGGSAVPLPAPSGEAAPMPVPPGSEKDPALDEFISELNKETKPKAAQTDPLASIIVTSQAAPLPPPKPAIEVTNDPPMPAPEPAIEVTKEPAKDVDVFEAALANIKISDVIAKLEGLANIFRTREISRQLSVIDIMMDKLGIASYFPSLAEANSKTLESNQYALSRVEDILSKLRGSVEVPVKDQVDLTRPAPVEPIPEGNAEAVKENLADQAAAEKERKERRKQEQLALTEAIPPPQELAQPATIQQAPPPAPTV